MAQLTMREKSGMWVASRIGILLVFGIMLPLQTCSRPHAVHEMHKWDTFYEYIDKCDAAYDKADRETVNSPEWNKEVAVGNMWLGKAQQERNRITGTNAP